MSSLALLSEGEAELVSVLVWSSSVVSISSWLSEGELVVTVSTSTFGGSAGGGVGVAVGSGVDVDATAVGGRSDGDSGVTVIRGVDVESWRWCWYTWPTPVLSMLSPALLLSLKLVLWVVFPCSNATASLATAGGEVSLGSTGLLLLAAEEEGRRLGSRLQPLLSM